MVTRFYWILKTRKKMTPKQFTELEYCLKFPTRQTALLKRLLVQTWSSEGEDEVYQGFQSSWGSVNLQKPKSLLCISLELIRTISAFFPQINWSNLSLYFPNCFSGRGPIHRFQFDETYQSAVAVLWSSLLWSNLISSLDLCSLCSVFPWHFIFRCHRTWLNC